jgi:antibiotic biosynthesis monooxygenase (ABM) superfamily enzyme
MTAVVIMGLAPVNYLGTLAILSKATSRLATTLPILFSLMCQLLLQTGPQPPQRWKMTAVVIMGLAPVNYVVSSIWIVPSYGRVLGPIGCQLLAIAISVSAVVWLTLPIMVKLFRCVGANEPKTQENHIYAS